VKFEVALATAFGLCGVGMVKPGLFWPTAVAENVANRGFLIVF